MSDNLDNIIMKYEEALKDEPELFVDNLAIHNILPSMLVLQNRKERFYGESWRKYGDVGAFLNMARKWDRIEHIMKDAMETGTDKLFDESSGLSTETVLDTIIDLSMYGLLWSSYIASRFPNLWERFLKLNDLDFIITEPQDKEKCGE